MPSPPEIAVFLGRYYKRKGYVFNPPFGVGASDCLNIGVHDRNDEPLMGGVVSLYYPNIPQRDNTKMRITLMFCCGIRPTTW